MGFLTIPTGLIVLAIDAVLLYSFPFRIVLDTMGKLSILLLLLGLTAYSALHVMKKPVTFYVWNHEISHLLMAKLFFKKISLFQIAHKKGGKVALEKSNLLIDIAPYFLSPLALILLILSILLKKSGFSKIEAVYFFSLGFIYGMLLIFTGEAFLQGQEDLKRNGYLLSAALIILFLIGGVPLLITPSYGNPLSEIKNLYVMWGVNAKNALAMVVTHLHNLRR